MVGGRDLEIDAVGEHLFGKLLGKDLPAPFPPGPGRLGVAEKQADEDQPGGVGDQVVAVDVGPFQMPGREISV